MVQLPSKVRFTASILAVLVLFAALSMDRAGVHASEQIAGDHVGRLALFGYDPVAYLADGEAKQGSTQQELLFRRLVWRFSNEGNKHAFMRDPERYIPAYGGYGAYAAAHGDLVVGHPEIWIRLGTRIYLFEDAPSRYAFLLEAERLLTRADTNWDDLRRQLAP